MKRYGITVGLVLFLTIGLATYYIYNASDRLPDFRLVAAEGDPAIGNVIELDGTYGGRWRSEFLEVTSSGSEYASDRSLWRQEIANARSWFREQPGIRELIEAHRGFMRGKSDVYGFYRDEETVAYVEAASNPTEREIAVRLETLDRRDGRMASWERRVALDAAASHVSVLDVQRFGSELRVVVERGKPTAPGAKGRVDVPAREVFDLAFDWATGEPLRQSAVFGSAAFPPDVDAYGEVVGASDPTAPSEYLTYRSIEGASVPQEAGEGDPKAPRETERLFVYHYRTGSVTELSRRELSPDAQYEAQYETRGDHLARTWLEGGRVTIERFDLAGGTDAGRLDIGAADLGIEAILDTVLRDGRLYVLYTENRAPAVAALDASTGAPVYRGLVVAANESPEAEREARWLHLTNVNVR